MIANAIKTILAYKWNGLWVFDEESVGLVKEPFVAGADTLLDRISDGHQSIVLIFSDIEFPDYHFSTVLVDTAPSGSNYYCPELDHNLWLCPALFKFFPEAPQTIYVKAIPQ